MDETTRLAVQAFFNACSVFIKGSWSAKRGAVIKGTNAKGEETIKKVFDITCSTGQVNGTAELGSIVLVGKSKGDVALWVLTEALGERVDGQGMLLTMWKGTIVGK